MTMRDDEPSDAALVADTLAGDGRAFGLLYDRYARLVRAVVCDAAKKGPEIQDLTQECFLRAYRNLARLRQPDQFRFWMIGIARQVAREHCRARRRDRHMFVDGCTLEVESAPSAEVAVQDADEVGHVLRLLAELPERERLAIHAFFLRGCDARQAAEQLGLSRSGAYDLLRRAMMRLAAGVLEGERGDQ